MDAGLLDRKAFNPFVYYPLGEAVAEIMKRGGNATLESYVRENLPLGIPEMMRGKKSMVIFRHLATSNYEINRFAMIADSFPEFQPLIFEFIDDKFNDRNQWKYFLGKLRFHKGINSKEEVLYENINIINFNDSNNKPISSILTRWGDRLVDVHHHLFHAAFPQLRGSVYDLSNWIHNAGATPKEYYKRFFMLFIKDAILFENFVVDGDEHSFTRDVILPALIDIQSEIGVRPLIVALEPTEIEGDEFWLSHPNKIKQLLRRQMEDSHSAPHGSASVL